MLHQWQTLGEVHQMERDDQKQRMIVIQEELRRQMKEKSKMKKLEK